MIYTTDVAPGVADFAVEAHAQVVEQVANLHLEAHELEYCAVLRAIGPVGDEKADLEANLELAAKRELNATTLKEATRVAARLAKRVPRKRGKALADDKAAAREKRAAFLGAHVAQLEAAHAQHELLATAAIEAGVDPERQLIAMLSCEGAHQAALAEIAAMNPEPVKAKPSPTKRTNGGRRKA